jgi:hypothetical protein
VDPQLLRPGVLGPGLLVDEITGPLRPATTLKGTAVVLPRGGSGTRIEALWHGPGGHPLPSENRLAPARGSGWGDQGKRRGRGVRTGSQLAPDGLRLMAKRPRVRVDNRLLSGPRRRFWCKTNRGRVCAKRITELSLRWRGFEPRWFTRTVSLRPAVRVWGDQGAAGRVRTGAARITTTSAAADTTATKGARRPPPAAALGLFPKHLHDGFGDQPVRGRVLVGVDRASLLRLAYLSVPLSHPSATLFVEGRWSRARRCCSSRRAFLSREGP